MYSGVNARNGEFVVSGGASAPLATAAAALKDFELMLKRAAKINYDL